jgi:tRNA modification GTPase
VGGLGVVRVSGPEARDVAARLLRLDGPLEPRRATLATFRSTPRGARVEVTDQVVATWFPAPHSYTTDDVVELSAHGSPVVLDAIVASAVDAGARLARPGEFTLRAYVGGRLDLTQAEAVADLIASATPLQARAASEQLEGGLRRQIDAAHARLFDIVARLEASLDFPEEGYHFIEPSDVSAQLNAISAEVRALARSGAAGRLIREGVTVALAGRPNTGKSSLFNRLAGAERAIVTQRPGTTRDVLTEVVDLGGLRATIVDTAGVRQTADEIEAEGVRRATAAAQTASVVVVVVDGSEPIAEDDLKVLASTSGPLVVAVNKSDLPTCEDLSVWRSHVASTTRSNVRLVAVSALTGDGIEDLTSAILTALGSTAASEEIPRVTNLRHIALLENASKELERAASAAADAQPEEIVLADLHAARQALEEIVGVHATDDLLEHIFARFCVGK